MKALVCAWELERDFTWSVVVIRPRVQEEQKFLAESHVSFTITQYIYTCEKWRHCITLIYICKSFWNHAMMWHDSIYRQTSGCFRGTRKLGLSSMYPGHVPMFAKFTLRGRMPKKWKRTFPLLYKVRSRCCGEFRDDDRSMPATWTEVLPVLALASFSSFISPSFSSLKSNPAVGKHGRSQESVSFTRPSNSDMQEKSYHMEGTSLNVK